MVGGKINIFYLISFICTIILTIYIWLVFLPQLSGYPGQEPISLIILVVIALLLVAAGIQLFLLISSPQSEE
ncbi:MAG: hypothetical protein N3E47_02430 [Candidatus Bathyarchaeota archaeon]|nr:hypothetical protein [Candidatus Bathyarchaeota archaeon]